MTIQEMHIEVNLSSQKVASSVNRKLLPQEIDWFLNKTIGRFVADAVKPAELQGDSDFQENQLELDKIQTLINPEPVLLQVYKSSLVSKMVTAALPSDYMHLVSDSSEVIQVCDVPKLPAFKPVTEYQYRFKVSESTKQAKPFYTGTSLTIDGKTLLSPEDLPANLQDKTMRFELVNKLEEVFQMNGIQAYWERYRNQVFFNQFIVVSRAPLSIQFRVEDTPITVTEKQVEVLSVSASGKLVDNRLTKSDKLMQLKQSSFSRTHSFSPLSALAGDLLMIYHDESFIVSRAAITYVRRPRRVSVILGINCDLPAEFHPQICDHTVEYIKQTIQDPNYQWKLQDNKLRVD